MKQHYCPGRRRSTWADLGAAVVIVALALLIGYALAS